MRSFVTGATGFVGPHLVAHLRDSGDEVVAAGGDELDVTDPAAVRERIVAEAPEAVYHLAALSHVGASWEAPSRSFRVNAEGTLNVLRGCVEASVRRVLVVASADAYGAVGADGLPLAEDAPLRPLTPYGASKVAADYLALQAHLGDGLATIRARAFNHTGPGQPARFLVPSVAERIALAERAGETRLAIGNLEPVRDFLDVRDVVRAYRMLVEDGEPGAVYNVCSGTGRSVAEVVGALTELAGSGVEPAVDPELVRPVEVPRLVGDNAALREATGWTPAIPFEQTLADVLEDQRRRVAPRS